MKSFEFIPAHAKQISKAVAPQLCEEVLAKTERDFHFRPCKFNDQVNTDYRDCSEIKIQDNELIDRIWSEIKPHVPPICDGEALIGPHYSRVYLLRYFKGQFFRRHYDGSSTSSKGHQSRLSVLIYLNDMDEKTGGATRFYAEKDRGVGFSHPHINQPHFDVIPRIGTVVMFTHRLLHEGMPIKLGYKYCLRFNVLYTKTPLTKTPLTESPPPEKRSRTPTKHESAPEQNAKQTQNPKTQPSTLAKTRPYTYPNKYRKLTESGTGINDNEDSDTDAESFESEDETVIEFTEPSPNGLKYKSAQFKTESGIVVTLTRAPDNYSSRQRWEDIGLRPHVFTIERADFPGFIDTAMGRPPTWEEDFCPNCYEILTLDQLYANCSGCLYPVLSIDEILREKRMDM